MVIYLVLHLIGDRLASIDPITFTLHNDPGMQLATTHKDLYCFGCFKDPAPERKNNNTKFLASWASISDLGYKPICHTDNIDATVALLIVFM